MRGRSGYTTDQSDIAYMLSRMDVSTYRVFIVHSHQVPYDALFHIPYHIRGKALLCEGVAYRSLIVCQGTLPCRFMAITSSWFCQIMAFAYASL
jgi:hypothetical protein